MKINQVAIQLYTLRDHCQTAADLAATMKKVRTIGYQSVQISGLGPIPPNEIAAIVQGEGLTTCATHEDSKTILDDTQKAIDRLLALGTKLTAYPYPAGVDFHNPEHIETLVEKLDAAGAKFRAAGLTLGYHNHANEFFKYKGTTVLDYIYTSISPENLVAELDTFWVQRGGGDVVDWVTRMAGRQPFIHLKDFQVNAAAEISFCEIGNGTLPFDRIIAAAEKGGCEWFIVEQDSCPGDPFDSIKQSFDYIQANLIS